MRWDASGYLAADQCDRPDVSGGWVLPQTCSPSHDIAHAIAKRQKRQKYRKTKIHKYIFPKHILISFCNIQLFTWSFNKCIIAVKHILCIHDIAHCTSLVLGLRILNPFTLGAWIKSRSSPNMLLAPMTLQMLVPILNPGKQNWECFKDFETHEYSNSLEGIN